MDKAIEIDLLRLTDKPYNISANISLVRNYQLAGNVEKAQQHLQQALDVGLSKKASDPENPNTAYWLGTCYTLKEIMLLPIRSSKRPPDYALHRLNSKKLY